MTAIAGVAAEPRLVVDAPLAHLRFEAASPSAPLVVLLHGIGGGRGGWDATGRTLAAAGFTTLAVDLPGYGLSPRPAAPVTIAGFASAVRALIAASGAPRAVIVGHSLGGMVAQELAASAPEAVAALVLAGTSPAFGPPGGDWQQRFVRDRTAPLDAGLGMAGLAAQLVPAMAGRDAGADALAAAQALMAGVPEATYRAVLEALVRFDRREALARIAVPSLVIAGEDDRTAPPEVAARMAWRIPGAECVVLPRTGHLMMLEQPAAFDAALLGFLQRHAAPRAADRPAAPEEPADVRPA